MQDIRYCQCTPDCDVPYGYCHCRQCDEKTTVSPQTVRKLGYVKGEPRPYVFNHDKRGTGPEYSVDPETGCWIWQRYVTKKGYALMRPHGAKRMHPAHRIFYERKYGPIPAGAQLDHVCHSNDTSCPGGACIHRRCVNPAHLEPVTNTENQRRGRKSKLSLEAVREIRATPAGYGTTKALADKFGVNTSTIRRVVSAPDRYWVDE